MNKFEAGKEYTHGYATNADLTVTIKIERRTEKNVWIEGKRKKIYTSSNGEYIMPHGFYSMAPSLHAEDLVEEIVEVVEVIEIVKTEKEIFIEKSNKLVEILNFEECLEVFEKIPTGSPLAEILFDRMECLDSERFDNFLDNKGEFAEKEEEVIEIKKTKENKKINYRSSGNKVYKNLENVSCINNKNSVVLLC